MSDKCPDYYQILGVEREATQKQIKEAYRFKVFTMHPDRVTDSYKDRANDELKKINIAYEILGDPQKRELYDLELDKAQENQKNQSDQQIMSIDKKILNIFSEDRRNELINEIDRLIASPYLGKSIEYTSQGFRVNNIIYFSNEAKKGTPYSYHEIAMILREPQASVEEALRRLLKTPYVYRINDKYGATPKYFGDHPEIYDVRTYGIKMQEEKDLADQAKRDMEIAAKQVENAKKEAEMQEKHQKAKEARQFRNRRGRKSLLDLLFFVAFILMWIYFERMYMDIYANIFLFLALLTLIYLFYVAWRFGNVNACDVCNPDLDSKSIQSLASGVCKICGLHCCKNCFKNGLCKFCSFENSKENHAKQS